MALFDFLRGGPTGQARFEKDPFYSGSAMEVAQGAPQGQAAFTGGQATADRGPGDFLDPNLLNVAALMGSTLGKGGTLATAMGDAASQQIRNRQFQKAAGGLSQQEATARNQAMQALLGGGLIGPQESELTADEVTFGGDGSFTIKKRPTKVQPGMGEERPLEAFPRAPTGPAPGVNLPGGVQPVEPEIPPEPIIPPQPRQEFEQLIAQGGRQNYSPFF